MTRGRTSLLFLTCVCAMAAIASAKSTTRPALSEESDATLNTRIASIAERWQVQMQSSPEAADLHRRFGLSPEKADAALAKDLVRLQTQADYVRRQPPVEIKPRDWTKLSLEDGRFVLESRPAFPAGFSWFDEPEFARFHEGIVPLAEARRDFRPTLGPVVQEMQSIGAGLHEVNVRISALATADPDEGDRTAQWLRDRLDLYAEHGAAANVLFIWARTADLEERYPGITAKQKGFFRLDPDHPAFRKVAGGAIDTLMAEIGDHPALKAVCLANEPEFALESWTPYTVKRFQDWLHAEYATVEALNERWLTQLASFEDVGEPGRQADVSPAQWYDTIRFHEARIVETFRFLANRVRAGSDDGVALHIKIQDVSVIGTRPVFATAGLDREALSTLTDLHGIDTRLLPVADPRLTAHSWNGDDYALHWIPATLTYDLLRSFQPDQTVFDTELHAFSTTPQRFGDMNPAHGAAAAWLPAIFGSTGNIAWYWQRRDDLARRHLALSHAYHGSLTTQPGVLFEFLRAHAELNQHGEIVARLADAPRPIGIVYSHTSRLHDVGHVHALHEAYEALSWLGVGVRFVTEDQLARGEAADLAVVVEAGVTHLPLAAAETLAALPDAKRVRFNTAPPMRDPWGDPFASAATSGTTLQDPATLRQTVGQQLAAAGVLPTLRVETTDDSPLRTLVRSVGTESAGVAGLVHVGAQPARLNLALPGDVTVMDVRTGEVLEGRTVEMQLLEVRVLRWGDVEPGTD